MTEPKLTVTVTEIRGTGECPLGLKKGDKFTLREDKVDFCLWAHHAMYPFITPLRFGGSLPWEPDPDKAYVCCPDPYNTVVFKIARKRVRQKKKR